MGKKAKTSSRKAAPARASKGAKATSKAAAKKASASSQIYVCPNTQQNIYIGRATLQDLKSASTYANSNKKRLWMISSPQTRNDLYLDAAEAIANYEQSLLPSFGGRSWEVTCRLTEPQWSGQVLFRAFKGKMELAALPHMIEKIPDPPVWAGKKSRPDEYLVEVGVRVDDATTMGATAIQGLQQRDISSLSQAAWDMREKYPVPTVAVKWVTPERKIFNSRKAAWEHATEMAEREVQINKIMRGIGSSGKLLSPFFPSAATALKVGKLRFERDGLWVVGQEFNWQENRPEELEEEQILEEERRQSIVPKSGLALFLQKKRVEYRNEHEECSTFRDAEVELRKIWKALPKEEQMKWNNQVRKERGEPEKKVKPVVEKKSKPKKKPVQEIPPEPVLSMTPKAFFVKSSRQEYREERKAQGWPISLSEADIWLRDKWKNHMSPEMREEWKQKLIAHDKAIEEEEKLKQPATEEVPKQSNVMDVEKVGEVLCADEKKEESEREPSTELASEEPITAKPSDVATKEDEGSTTKPDAEKVESEKLSKLEQEDTPAQAEPGPMALVEEEKKEEDHWTPVPPSTDEFPKADEAVSLETEKQVVPLPPKKVFKKVEVPKASRVRWCMNQEQMDLCFSACMEHFDTVMRTVKARDLHRELEDGFDVLRERGHGRFDMELPAFDTEVFDFLTDPEKSPWMPIVRTILGDDAVLIHKGSFLSLPGAASQEYHQDGVHLTTQTQRPCHAINVFIPLIDMSMRNGPTEFCLGTHVLGLEGYDRDFLETPLPMAGQPVIFDYRLGHRGLGNTSQICRPIVYCTYARGASDHGMKEFRDSVNFSRKRYHRIGEMSSKPVSREERRENRKRSLEAREEALLQKALEDSTEAAEAAVASPSSCGDKKPKVDEGEVDTAGKEASTTAVEAKPETEVTEPKTDERET